MTLFNDGFIIQIDKVSNNSSYKHNCYKLPILTEYSAVNCSLLSVADLDATLKGVLIYLKLNCYNGTNIIEYKSISELADKIGINRNKLGAYIKTLSELNYLTLHTGWLDLSQEFFPLYFKNTLENKAYKFIYDFCISKECIPPYKDVGRRSKIDTDLLTLLDSAYYYKDKDKFYGMDALEKLMNTRITNLPSKINFAYLKSIVIPKPSKYLPVC